MSGRSASAWCAGRRCPPRHWWRTGRYRRRTSAAPNHRPVLAERALHHGIEGYGLQAGMLDIGLQMVLQVLPHPGQVMDHRNVELAQMIGRADSREHQDLGRVDRPAGDDHLAPDAGRRLLPGLQIFHAHGAPPLEEDPGGERAGEKLDIAAPDRGPEIGLGSTPAPTPAGRHIHRPQPFLLIAVEIVGHGIAGLLAGFDPGLNSGWGVWPRLTCSGPSPP